MRRAFHSRTFRRLLLGRIVTNVGDSLYFVGAMWLVYELSGDPFVTGLAGFLTMAPSALQFLAGPLVDRWSIRRTLVGTQTIQAVVVSAVPLAYVAGHLTVTVVLVVMPTLAALNQFVYPAQTATLPRILDDEALVAANSAFSIAYQGVSMVANGVGGVLVGLLGAVVLFAIDAATFAIAALVFATLSIPAATTPVRSDDRLAYLDRLYEGVDLLRGTVLLWLVAGAAVVNFASGMVIATIPVYADSLAVPPALAAVGAAGSYGVLMASFAAGNLVGAVGATLLADRRLGVVLIVGCAISGMVWIAGLLADRLLLTAPLVALALVPVGAINVQLAAVVQSAPPNEYVGRLSSVMGSASAATVPIGSLAGGAVAASFGPRAGMAGFGVGVLLLATYVLVHPSLRTLPSPTRVSL